MIAVAAIVIALIASMTGSSDKSKTPNNSDSTTSSTTTDENKSSNDKQMIEGLDSYIEVSSNSEHTLNSIVSNDNFTGEKYITVSDGQYLKYIPKHIIRGGYI